jgi:hypothetical protein
MRWMLILALVACGAESSSEDTSEPAPIVPDADAIAKVTENGPVKAKVLVWPAKPSLSDPIYVRLEVEAPVGVSIDAPFQEAGDQRLGRFRVVGFARDQQRTASGGQLTQQTYTLEAPSSGRHRVPPLRLEMIDARGGAADAKAKPQELLTDEVPLEVAPVPTERASAELDPAYGALDPEVGGTSWVSILGLVSLLLVAGAGGTLAFRAFKQRRIVEQQRSAYEVAIAHLEDLAQRGAPDAKEADGWFVSLSSIVRGYLESRYNIRAPELTTEEFLLVATARPELHEDHRTQLTEFLERCDRVKFAGYLPDAEESLATLAAARKFVEDTKISIGDTRRAA